MAWTNYHGHCSFCDGRAEAPAFVEEALKRGFVAMGFSSHAPTPFESDWNMKREDLPAYLSCIESLKKKYQGRIQIYKSLEVDYIEGVMSPNGSMVQEAALDYVVASVHYAGRYDHKNYWTVDGTLEHFEEGLRDIFHGDIKVLVANYYRLVCQMMEGGGLDIVGHIDKVAMHNGENRFFDPQSKWYQDYVKETLELAGEKELTVEVNTKSIDRLGIFYPDLSLFRFLKEKQVPLTINSDVHDPHKIDLGFTQAATLLKAAGYQTLRVLLDGKWQDVPFDEKGLEIQR